MHLHSDRKLRINWAQRPKRNNAESSSKPACNPTKLWSGNKFPYSLEVCEEQRRFNTKREQGCYTTLPLIKTRWINVCPNFGRNYKSNKLQIILASNCFATMCSCRWNNNCLCYDSDINPFWDLGSLLLSLVSDIGLFCVHVDLHNSFSNTEHFMKQIIFLQQGNSFMSPPVLIQATNFSKDILDNAFRL